MLWLGSFWQCHHAAIEIYTKLGKEAGLEAINLLHTLQSGGEEGDCCLPEGSWAEFCSVCLYVPKVRGWALRMTIYGNINSSCSALLEIYGHKPKRTALYCGTSEVVNVWHNSGVSKLSACKYFAKLRIVIVGGVKKSRFSPVIAYMQVPL